ncbi:hypothetical protein HYQ46_007461 [Verticillium longisporum]|nr:hypothetical protein HYQ46_007461 [Verticillium longisporum]
MPGDPCKRCPENARSRRWMPWRRSRYSALTAHPSPIQRVSTDVSVPTFKRQRDAAASQTAAAEHDHEP